MLRLAGALEDASEHPIARAIARGARDRVGTLPAVEDFANLEGLGVQGIVDGHGRRVVGRPRLLAERSQHLPPDLDGAVGRGRGGRRHGGRGRLGRPGPRRPRRRRRGQADLGRGGRRSCASSGCARCC